MPSNIPVPIPARHLPLYEVGLAAGTDTGLRLALDTLTAERIRQERLMDAHPDSTSPAASRHDFAAGCLLDVSKTIAGRFRQ